MKVDERSSVTSVLYQDTIQKHGMQFESMQACVVVAKRESKALKLSGLACSLHADQPGPPLHAQAPRQGCRADPQVQDALKSGHPHNTVITKKKMSSIPTETGEKRDTEKLLPGGKKIINGIVYDADGKP